MLSRTAVIILALFLAMIAAVLICAMFAMSDTGCTAHYEAAVAQPYRQLVTHMRQLADAGRTDELRRVIKQADERSSEISSFVKGPADSYRNQVKELTR